MRDVDRGVIELLNAALLTDLLAPGRLHLIPVLGAAAAAHLKTHLQDPRVLPLRKAAKKGPGALDAARVKRAITEWLEQLPAQVAPLVASGELVELSCRIGKKDERGWVLTPSGQRSAGRVRISAQLDRALAELEKRCVELRELMAESEGADLAPALREAYARLDADGGGYVPIHRLRAAVACTRERFDETLRGLRRERVVDLQVGADSDYRPEEIVNSLQDSDGTLYLTLTWRR